MLGRSAFIVVFGLLSAVLARGQESDGKAGLAGIWEGKLQVGMSALRVVLDVARVDHGAYTATLDSIDQGAMDLPVDEIVFAKGRLDFKMEGIGAGYTGTMSADGRSIDGTWTQGMKLPLVFERVEKAPEIRRPQNPKKPLPYRSEDVAWSWAPGRGLDESFLPRAARDDASRITLAGTLTLPAGAGPHPGVVLISGSGPQDRDETLAAHRPFLVLADHLTRRGIAVLRYDDRGFGESTGDHAAADSRDFARDAAAALRYLETRKEVDGKKTGLVGHSEGGLIAPMVAGLTDGVDFIVLLAGPGVPGDEIIKLQGRLIGRAMGQSEATVERESALREKAFAIVVGEADEAARDRALRELFGRYHDDSSEAVRPALGDRATFVEGQVMTLTSPWFRFFLGYDPRPALRKVRCPVLAVNGGKDLQVDPAQNLPAISAALDEAGNGDYKVVKLKGLNHLFQTCETGTMAEYPVIEETFSPLALQTVSDWIVTRFVTL